MEGHLNLQRDHQSRIFKAFTNYKKSPKERITTSYLQTRLEDLERLWQQFNLDHQQILKSYDTASLRETQYMSEDMYDLTNELYVQYKCELKEKISECISVPSFANPIVSSSGSKPNQVKLPRITIPTFSGQYTEWMSFRELFISLIHNNTEIDNVQKLHYLKAHLTGEAEQLLRHKPLTNDSYEQCWALLKSRYNNKQYLGNNILRRFFAQKTLFTESATDIKNLLDCTTETLDALSSLGVDTSSWDIIVIYIVSQKLDSDSRRQWECKVSENLSKSEQLPTIDQFKNFLQTRYHSMEFMEPSSSKPKFPFNDNKSNVNYVKSTPVQMFNNFHVTNVSCRFCKGEHRIVYCKEFGKLDVIEKRNFVQNNGLCFNCLGDNHAVRFCKNTSSCQICNRRHHSLIHYQGELQSVGIGSAGCQAAQDHIHQVIPVQEEAEQCTSISNHFVNEVTQQVLLPTAVVEVKSSDKEERHLLRALIDQGSQASFITSAEVQILGLKRVSAKGLVSGLGGKQDVISNFTVEVNVSSRVKAGYALKIKAYVLDKLSSYLPSARVSLADWPELENINLADPDDYASNTIDMLMGAEVYAQIVDTGLIKCPSNGSLVAQNTALGWIVSGQVGSNTNICNVINVNHTQVKQLSRFFWEMDSKPNNKPRILSPEKQRCKDIYHSTTTKDGNGRYIERLPFREEEPACVDGNSREIMLRSFHSLEKRLQRDPHLQNNAKEFHEYRESNHMELFTRTESKVRDGVYKQMSEGLSKGCFELQNWLNNNKETLAGMRESNTDKEGLKQFEMKQKTENRILQLTWDRGRDGWKHVIQPLLPGLSETRGKNG